MEREECATGTLVYRVHMGIRPTPTADSDIHTEKARRCFFLFVCFKQSCFFNNETRILFISLLSSCLATYPAFFHLYYFTLKDDDGPRFVSATRDNRQIQTQPKRRGS